MKRPRQRTGLHSEMQCACIYRVSEDKERVGCFSPFPRPLNLRHSYGEKIKNKTKFTYIVFNYRRSNYPNKYVTVISTVGMDLISIHKEKL